MGNVYSSRLGLGQEQSIGDFAQAIRRLSTAHKRATNMADATRLQLKWAEETHTAQLAKYQADIDLTNKRNVALQDELGRREEESQRVTGQLKQQEATRKTVSTNVHGMIKSWEKYKKDGDVTAKTSFYDAYANIMAADPKQAIEMGRIFSGLVGAETGLKAAETDIAHEMALTAQATAQTRESGARLVGQELTNKLRMQELLQDDAGIEKYRKFKSMVKESAYNEMGITAQKPAIEEERRITIQAFDDKIKVEVQKISVEKDKMKAQMDAASYDKLGQILSGKGGDKVGLIQAIDTSGLDAEGNAAIEEMSRLYTEKTAAERHFSAQMREQEDFDFMVDEASEYAYSTMNLRGPGAAFKVSDLLADIFPSLAQMRKDSFDRYKELRAASSPDVTDDTINKDVTRELFSKWEEKIPPNMWGLAKNLFVKGFYNDMNSRRNAIKIFGAPPTEVTEE